jgi:competence protein ComEC
MALSGYIRAALPGDVGGFAAAVTSGDRSGVTQDALHALRASNLAHLLAISGLHMGLLAGFVFALLRLVMAAIPPLALRWPVRKIAAAGALAAGAVYLALSGGNVATERAFIMVAVVLCAVMVNRRAFSLRAVAVAALIVLTLRPEALMGPGFQMSFAATTVLVAVFGMIRDAELPRAPGWLQPVLGVVISSTIAGLATAPVGAAHFNTTAHYGLIANLVSVPVMGVLVVPSAVLAVLLWPLGLDMIALWLMGLGLRWILFVAHWVTGLEGAQGFVISPGAEVLPMLSLGMLFVILWQGRARLAGLVPAALALVLWSAAERPEILVAESGGLVGVLGENGRALSKARGAGFVAQSWLENDGDGEEQGGAAARWPAPDGAVRIHGIGDDKTLYHLIGKKGVAAFKTCNKGDIVVTSVTFDPLGECMVLDPDHLRKTGSVAFHHGQMRTANGVSGARIWNGGSGHAKRDQ